MTKEGIQPDPSKVDVLHHAGRPDNKEDVISFLCKIQSLSDFILKLSQKTYHLRQLTKKHQQFKWKKHHQQGFENLKSALSNNTLLIYCQPNKPTYIYTDVQKYRLSATFLQGKTLNTATPVDFSSTAISVIIHNSTWKPLLLIMGCNYAIIISQEALKLILSLTTGL